MKKEMTPDTMWLVIFLDFVLAVCFVSECYGWANNADMWTMIVLVWLVINAFVGVLYNLWCYSYNKKKICGCIKPESLSMPGIWWLCGVLIFVVVWYVTSPESKPPVPLGVPEEQRFAPGCYDCGCAGSGSPDYTSIAHPEKKEILDAECYWLKRTGWSGGCVFVCLEEVKGNWARTFYWMAGGDCDGGFLYKGKNGKWRAVDWHNPWDEGDERWIFTSRDGMFIPRLIRNGEKK